MTEKHLESRASALDPRRPRVWAYCPFCEGHFEAGMAPPVAGRGAPPGRLLHSLPPCERFVRLTPLEFLRAAMRETRGLTRE